MKYRSVALAITLSVATAGGAAACYARSTQLKSDAKLIQLRANAQAAEYASTFDGQYADQQLGTYELRRQVEERSEQWKRAQMLLVLAAVVLAFGSYCLFLMARLREQLLQGTGEHEELDAALAASKRRPSQPIAQVR